MKNIAILSSHNGSTFSAIHKAIEDNILEANIPLVISNNTNAKVLQKAMLYNIDNFVINAKTDTNPDNKIYELLKEYDCEYIYLSGYMKKIPALITDNFKVINAHPALLPKYGGQGMYGKFVHEAVIKNGESKSGVTVHEVNEHYDEGAIILQEMITLSENETVESLETKVKQLEAKTVIRALQKCLK